MGLAHTVPGAEIRLRTINGTEHVIGNHPASEMDLCALRQTVIASFAPRRPDLSHWIDQVEVGGSLTPVSAGLFTAVANPNGEFWFATLLRHTAVSTLLSAVNARLEVDDRIEVEVRPDLCLDVTAIGLAARRDRLEIETKRVAIAVYEACIVEEFVAGAGTVGRF